MWDDLGVLLELGRSELLMTINAVFDESGKHNDCDHVVFAGLLFPMERCQQFSYQWGLRLRRSGLKNFHMVELNSQYQRASGNSALRASIELLVKDLAQVICEFAIEGISNGITVAEFNALPQDKRKRYKDPFYYAFEHGIVAMAESSSLAPDDLISLLCDDSEEYAVECLKAFKRLQTKNLAVAERIGIIAFGNDKKYAPLQAADMFAYCFRAARANATSGLWTEPYSLIMNTMTEYSQRDIIINGENAE